MRYILYDVLSDYSLSKVEGKSDFGTLAHAKQRAVDDNRGGKIKWLKDTKWGVGRKAWKGFNKHKELINIVAETISDSTGSFEILQNPKGKFTAKQLAELKKRFAGIDKIDPASPTYKTLIAAIDLYSQTMLKQLAKADIKFLSMLAKNRIKRKGNPKMKRKKKRSTKQLANDKRLGRMARARAKANRGGRRKTVSKKIRRKVTRKKNVHATRRRTSLKKSHLWRVFRCRGKSVFWIFMDSSGKWSWTKDAGKSILFATQKYAGIVAKGIAKKRGYAPYQLGAAPREMSAAQIVAGCQQGK